jgi:peptide-methionine (S)-S-oxide reductase
MKSNRAIPRRGAGSAPRELPLFGEASSASLGDSGPRAARPAEILRKRVTPLALALTLALSVLPMNAQATPGNTNAPAQLATFGGGCFWCLEAVFERFEGVSSVISGYAGGHTPAPTYKEVCGGRTGHAEVVQIQFDPKRITYDQLLEIFWECHDPTTPDRQGADEGTQYRSIILCYDEVQKQAAEKSKEAAAKRFKDPIVTEIAPLKQFHPAEAYHQDYYRLNPKYPYCAIVISPKLKKLEKAGLFQGRATNPPK